jgi:alpha-ribazole phosphatase
VTSVTTRWWWLRHAPVINHGGVIYGNSEVDCDLSDERTFRALATRLPRDAVWVTSQLGRTQKTAAALAAAGGQSALERFVEPHLAEQDFGVWQGRTLDEIHGAGEVTRQRFWHSPASHEPPGGESFATVVERVSKVVERLTRTHEGRDIVVVAHGGSIRAALAMALGLEPEAVLAFQIGTLSLTRLDYVSYPDQDGKWRVVGVNLPAT